MLDGVCPEQEDYDEKDEPDRYKVVEQKFNSYSQEERDQELNATRDLYKNHIKDFQNFAQNFRNLQPGQ